MCCECKTKYEIIAEALLISNLPYAIPIPTSSPKTTPIPMGIPWEWEFPFPCTPLVLKAKIQVIGLCNTDIDDDNEDNNHWCFVFLRRVNRRTLSAMANSEQQSRCNWEVFGIAAAGVIQVTAGVYLGSCTKGALLVGICLIRLGSLDVVCAIRTGFAKTFSWTEYLIDKAISIPFTGLSVGVELWLLGGTDMRWGLRKVVRTVGLASARGVTVVCFGEALKKAKETILEKVHEICAEEIDRIFAQEFDDIQKRVEDMFFLAPSNAEKLVLGALEDANSTADEVSGSILDGIGSAVVEYLPTTIVESSMLFLSYKTARNFGDRAIDCAKFITVVTTSAIECQSFARHFVRSLQEAVSIRHRRLQTCESRCVSESADPEAVRNFTARFKRRVKSFIVRRVGEKVRRGLVLATSQTFIASGIAEVADVAGI